MRPKSRMKPLLRKLRKLWKSAPCYQDLRLGQFLYALAAGEKADLFNLEDDRLEQIIERELDHNKIPY